MQLTDTLASVFTPLGWMGVDLLSFMQILICFVLGLVVKRICNRSQVVLLPAMSKEKKLDKEAVDNRSDKAPGETMSSHSTALMSTKKVGHVKAKERKRARKTQEMTSESPSEGEAVKSKVVESVPKPQLASDELIQLVSEKEWQTVQGKAEKQRSKKREQSENSWATEARDGEGKTQLEDSTAYLHGQAEQAPFSEKHDDQHVEEEPMLQDRSGEKHDNDGDSTPSTRVADVFSESQTSVASVESTASQSETESLFDNQTETLSDNLPNYPVLPADHEVQGETEALGFCEISTPELTPRNVSSPSMQWSGMTPLHTTEDQTLQEVQPEVHVDWVPVAIPIEYLQTADEGTTVHPACFFNGFWQNSGNEKIMIEGSELKFENGPVWVMKDYNLNGFSVELEGDVYHAQLAVGGQQVLWSDGDIWTCIGRLQHNPTPVWIQDQSELNSIMMAAEGQMSPSSDLACVDSMPAMLPAVPEANTQSDAEDDWEECWDWKKKGWCYRGEKCEWKHLPCRMRQSEGPVGALYAHAVDSNDPMLCEPCA